MAAPSPVQPTALRLAECAIIGSGTRELIVPAHQVPALRDAFVTYCGISDVTPTYRFVRRNPEISQLMVTISGAGAVLLNDRWERLEQGMAFLTPPRRLHAYHALPNTPWQIAWINYVEPAGEPPAIDVREPTVMRVNEQLIHAALSGLYHEFSGSADPVMLNRWGELLHAYVLRFARPRPANDPLWHIWERVNADLRHHWTVAELADLAGVSEEYLRQLCHRYYHRSPLKHTAFLRMRRAISLLKGTDQKLEVIARSLGYDNSFTFSRAFKRWMGVAPDHFRRGARGQGKDTPTGAVFPSDNPSFT
jgi:AraC-like DNA-binding protein